MNVLCVSYGNDSIALIQAAHEAGLKSAYVLFNDTGWADPSWGQRILDGEAFARDCGFIPHRTVSIGMEALVMMKKAWPRQGMQFCTEELKIKPTLEWLEVHDPDATATLYNGKRRVESANRANIPLYIKAEDAPLKRLTISPLYLLTDAERDELVVAAGFEVLPYRSKECGACVNANRSDVISFSEPVIANIERIEKNMGITGNGKPRTLYRPYRHMGATGIREIVRWAKSKRGKFSLDDGNGVAGCDSGMCGG